MTDSLTARERWLLAELRRRVMGRYESRIPSPISDLIITIDMWLAEPPSPPQDGGDRGTGDDSLNLAYTEAAKKLTDGLAALGAAATAAPAPEWRAKLAEYESRVQWARRNNIGWEPSVKLAADELEALIAYARAASERAAQDGGSTTYRATPAHGIAPEAADLAAATATPTPAAHALDALGFDNVVGCFAMLEGELRDQGRPYAAECLKYAAARLSAPERAPPSERPIPRWIDYAEHAELMTKERAAGFAEGAASATPSAEADAGPWMPERCVICWKVITPYDTYGVSHPPGRRWHWDCCKAQADHAGGSVERAAGFAAGVEKALAEANSTATSYTNSPEARFGAARVVDRIKALSPAAAPDALLPGLRAVVAKWRELESGRTDESHVLWYQISKWLDAEIARRAAEGETNV